MYFVLLICMAAAATASAVQVIPDGDFVKPDAKAQDCLNALKALHLVQQCQNDSLWRYSPERMHTNVTTDWEMCCQVHDELMCYKNNADQYCPEANAASVGSYAEQNLFVLENSVCTDPGYQHWGQYCANLSREHEHRHGHKPEFRLPATNDTAVNNCLNELQKGPATEGGNLIEIQCRRPIQAKLHWEENKQQDINELCCAWYRMLECVQHQAIGVCSSSEQIRLVTYEAGVRAGFQRWCRSIPYGQNDVLNTTTRKRCHDLGFDLTGDGQNGAPSPVAATISWLLPMLLLVVAIR